MNLYSFSKLYIHHPKILNKLVISLLLKLQVVHIFPTDLLC
jgi:hypothetical protein